MLLEFTRLAPFLLDSPTPQLTFVAPTFYSYSAYSDYSEEAKGLLPNTVASPWHQKLFRMNKRTDTCFIFPHFLSRVPALSCPFLEKRLAVEVDGQKVCPSSSSHFPPISTTFLSLPSVSCPPISSLSLKKMFYAPGRIVHKILAN